MINIIGFVPALVVQYLTSKQPTTPDKQSFKSVVMFADISGFTNLTERLSKIGPEGAELIAFAINRYMELLVSAINKSGGDIFKFAGGILYTNKKDAMIVVWPPSTKTGRVEQYEELKTICRQALQSALDIQQKLDNTTIIEDIKLSVKIGFGIGDISIIYVGGVFGRSEYLATGDPLTQAFQSEHQATSGGQIIISQQVYEMISDYFILERDESLKPNFYRVTKLISNFKVKFKADALLIKNNIGNFDAFKQQILMYIPAALLPYIEIEQEAWCSEIRRITILFINLGIDLSDASTQDGLLRIQKVIEIVQKCVYMHEGSLNKLLMDDKGSTLIVCFGLPPLKHQDDSARAILASQQLVEYLQRINCGCSIGIATGLAFTGVVGTAGSRREYSVLGDSVNLAARLMQSAMQEKQPILLCENTAHNAQHKIECSLYKELPMKGKSGLISCYIVKQEQRILKTHFDTLALQRMKINEDTLPIIGEEKSVKQIKELIQNFLDQDNQGAISLRDMDTERDFLLIKGSFGIGKTFIIRQIIKEYEGIQLSQQSLYKYNEKVRFLCVSLNSIERTFRMNGVRKIIKQLVPLIKTEMSLSELIQYIGQDHAQCIDLFEEILGLREKDLVAEFPHKIEQFDKQHEKGIASAIIKLFELYFEEKLIKKSKKYRKISISIDQGVEEYSDSDSSQKSRQSFQVEGERVAPLVLCLDDFQYYDALSYYIIKNIVKKFSRVFVVAVTRDQFWEIPIQSRKDHNHQPNKVQEQIYDRGLEMIAKSYNVNTHEVSIKGLTIQNHKNFDQKQFLLVYFGFNKFQKEQRSLVASMLHKFDHLLFTETRNLLINKNFSAYMHYYLHIKTHGHPLLQLHLVQNLIESGYFAIDQSSQTAIVTQELQDLMQSDQFITIQAPLASQLVNSSIIDSLSCLQLLLLKFASVIGDIFDVQTLYKIINIRQLNQQRMLFQIKLLTAKDIIEYMHGDGDNRYYRFVNPFMRDVVYQRMIYSQRRQIHALVAEQMQLIPQPYEYDDMKDFRKLEFHWKIAETRVSLQSVKPIKYSSRAKKSLIVKQIQMLTNNNDPKVILKRGYFYKRSDKGVSWQYRFCVIDSVEMRYYINDGNKEPAGILPLKQITCVQPIYDDVKKPDHSPYGLRITISNWIKKDKEKETRVFYFASRFEDELEEWAIYLEFAKANAIYLDFVQNCGKIQFPILLQQDAFDPHLTMLIQEIQKQNKKIIEQEPPKKVKKQSGNIFTPQNKTETRIQQQPPSMAIKRFSVRFSALSEQDDSFTYQSLKDKTKEFINKSLMLLIAHLITHQEETEQCHLGQMTRYIRRYQRHFVTSLSQIPSLADFQLQ